MKARTSFFTNQDRSRDEETPCANSNPGFSLRAASEQHNPYGDVDAASLLLLFLVKIFCTCGNDTANWLRSGAPTTSRRLASEGCVGTAARQASFYGRLFTKTGQKDGRTRTGESYQLKPHPWHQASKFFNRMQRGRPWHVESRPEKRFLPGQRRRWSRTSDGGISRPECLRHN